MRVCAERAFVAAWNDMLPFLKVMLPVCVPEPGAFAVIAVVCAGHVQRGDFRRLQ